VAEITFARARATVIPEHLRQYFWEYDPARLSLDESRHTILLRLLQEGGLDAVQWLRQNATDDEIPSHPSPRPRHRSQTAAILGPYAESPRFAGG
jgi:hypothetical protein